MKFNRLFYRKVWICIVFLSLVTLSCNLFSYVLPAAEDEEGEAGEAASAPYEPYVPEGGPPPAPVLTGEEITCTYVVAPDGNDGGAGSESQPWATFQFAADTAQPGDTVCFRGGTYSQDDLVRISQSGTAENLILFIAYPGERPILDGGGEVGEILQLLQHASYLRFSGFTFQNFRIWGIELSGENRYVHFDHLEIAGGEAAIHFTYGESSEGPPTEGPVEHITFEDSLVHDSQYSAVDCTPGPCNHMIIRRVEVYGTGLGGESHYGSDGIEFARGYPVLIEDCYVHDNGGDGIDLNSRDRDGHATGVIVRRNRVVRNHLNGIKLWAGGRIENNIVWGQGNSAIWSGTFHSTLEIVNNTVAYNMYDPAFGERNWAVVVGYPEEIDEPQVELLMVNNIFALNGGPQLGEPTALYLGSGVTVIEHHNLYFSRASEEITAEFLGREISQQDFEDGTWSNLTGQGDGSLVTDPLFLSGWQEVDIALQAGSPAIDAGDLDLCPLVDAFGNPRPVDGNGDGESACDMGAIEQQ